MRLWLLPGGAPMSSCTELTPRSFQGPVASAVFLCLFPGRAVSSFWCTWQMWLSHSPCVPTCSSKELVTSPVLLSPTSGSPDRELIGPGLLSCGLDGRVTANLTWVVVCTGLVKHP